jgi:hypothetical protein
MTAPTFDDFFSDSRIIRRLARLRAAEARRRHDVLFLRRLSTHAPSPHSPDGPLHEVLPPRRKWRRPRKRPSGNAAKINALAIELSARRGLEQLDSRPEKWALALREFIRRVAQYGLNDRN